MELVARSGAFVNMPLTAAQFEEGDQRVCQVDALIAAYNFSNEAFARDEGMLIDRTVQLPFVKEP